MRKVERQRAARFAILVSMSTHVYLSPHLDDAVLSCGGLIHHQTRRGDRVLVVTVCAGDPPPGPLSAFAESLHARWGVSARTALAVRRAEDLAALRLLGAAHRHLAVPDCIYRSDPETGAALYASESALFGDVSPAEAALAARLTQEFEILLEQERALNLYVPLGIGRHVDHQLTRQAAERLGRPLLYVEDYPYADRCLESDWIHLAQGMSPVIRRFGPEDFAAYCQSVACYRSQVSTFWPDDARMNLELGRFAGRLEAGRFGVRLWRAV